MLDKTKTHAKPEAAAYTPEQYLRDLKAVTDKALKAGVTLEHAAQATMGFAHALWDSCFDQRDDLLEQVKSDHPRWDAIGGDLSEHGFKN